MPVASERLHELARVVGVRVLDGLSASLVVVVVVRAGEVNPYRFVTPRSHHLDSASMPRLPLIHACLPLTLRAAGPARTRASALLGHSRCAHLAYVPNPEFRIMYSRGQYALSLGNPRKAEHVDGTRVGAVGICFVHGAPPPLFAHPARTLPIAYVLYRRTSVRFPTKGSNPSTGASLKRTTRSARSISAPRAGWNRSEPLLPTS